jgi:hypothetical protein
LLWFFSFFNGKTHYKWQFSIAMLVYQRVLLLNSTSAMENPRGLPTENDENKLCQAASQSEAQAQALDCETSGVKCQI